MKGPTNGFPEALLAAEPAPDHFRAYEHQEAAWDALDRHYGERGKTAGILVVPTGGGKTAIATRWLLRQHVRQGTRVLWLTHRRGLLNQAFDAFSRAAHLAAPKERLGLVAVSGQDRSWSGVSERHDIVFSTIQSAAREKASTFLDVLTHQSPGGVFVVVDEAHHAAARSYLRILDQLQKAGCPVLGLTATPVRMDPDDDRRLWNIFREIVYQIPKKVLIEKGVLSSPAIETVKTNVEFEREFTDADYDHLARFGELGPEVLARIAKHSGRNHLIARHYVSHADKYGKTIVFAVDTLHARTLVKEFQDNGVDADYVDYTRNDAATVMDGYRDHPKPQVLVNVEMLTEGYDAPRTQTVFLARPTKSEALLAQMVGRALRGPRAGGTERAFLVTFVDTWKQFHPLEAEYVLHEGKVDEVVGRPNVPTKLVPIAAELILESYKLVRSNVRGDFAGIYQCLPHGWRVWEEEFEDDIQRNAIMVFENQVDGFGRLEADFQDASSIPETVSEPFARELVRRYFGECQDPLPHWFDVKSLLDARRRAVTVNAYTFDEKAAFDPAGLARDIRDRDLGQQSIEAELRTIFQASSVCQLVYRNDLRAFFEDVDRELMALREPAPPPAPKFAETVLNEPPGPWPDGQEGHQLGTIWDAVVGQRKHFPRDAPIVRDLFFSSKPRCSHWGWFRYSDKALCVNRLLDSPDVPLFVAEFLVYHEALHADMPNASHNRDFRQRERRFTPSARALEDAACRGITAPPGPEAWYALADQFRDCSVISTTDSSEAARPFAVIGLASCRFDPPLSDWDRSPQPESTGSRSRPGIRPQTAPASGGAATCTAPLSSPKWFAVCRSPGGDRREVSVFYFRDLRGLPVQDYWHDMKFWWPRCEAIVAALLAWTLTGDEKYARWHRQVHEWSFKHFPDPEFGEWYGSPHRDGRVSMPLKGNMGKGPYHLPRMLWYCWRLLEELR